MSIEYDANFPTRCVGCFTELVYLCILFDYSYRGLLFDKKYGNFLKVDGFRNILEVFHGFSCLSL